MFMTPKFFLPFQNNTTNTTTKYYPTLTPSDITQKQKKCNDAVTFFKMWATIFVFTFPIISFPYHKEN